MDRYYNLMPQTPENNKIRLALEKYDLRRNTGEPTYYLKHAVPSGVNRIKVGGSNCGANNMLLDRPMGIFAKGQLVGGSFPMMELDSAPFMARARGGTNGRVRQPKGLIMPGAMARYPQYNMNEERYMDMQGAGVWEDMNAWGKQNERNFLAFVNNKENQDAARAIANDPAVQKAAKDAASATWKYMTAPKKGKGYPRKMTKKQMMQMQMDMQGAGVWEDMNAWGKQNERNFLAFIGNKENQDAARAIANDPAVQKAAKDAAAATWKYMTAPKSGKGYRRGKILRGRGLDEVPDLESATQAKNAGMEAAHKIKAMIEQKQKAQEMQGSGLWEDMNAWGRQNERNFNNFGRQVEEAVKDPNFGKDFARGFSAVMGPAAAVAALVPGLEPLAPVFGVLGAVSGAYAGSGIGMHGGGARTKWLMRGGGRAAIVKDVMMKSGMTLPQASKYVKENNLY
jgi:hypothetical protein